VRWLLELAVLFGGGGGGVAVFICRCGGLGASSLEPDASSTGTSLRRFEGRSLSLLSIGSFEGEAERAGRSSIPSIDIVLDDFAHIMLVMMLVMMLRYATSNETTITPIKHQTSTATNSAS
jgi:hypothetical protein